MPSIGSMNRLVDDMAMAVRQLEIGYPLSFSPVAKAKIARQFESRVKAALQGVLGAVADIMRQAIQSQATAPDSMQVKLGRVLAGSVGRQGAQDSIRETIWIVNSKALSRHARAGKEADFQRDLTKIKVTISILAEAARDLAAKSRS